MSFINVTILDVLKDFCGAYRHRGSNDNERHGKRNICEDSMLFIKFNPEYRGKEEDARKRCDNQWGFCNRGFPILLCF